MLENKLKIKSWQILLVGGIIISSFLTNRVDDFFNHNYLVYQSPVVVKTKQPEVKVVTVMATNQPVPSETPVPTIEPFIKK